EATMTQAKTQDGTVDVSPIQDQKSEPLHPETQEEPLALTGARAPGPYRGLVSIAAAVIIFWGLRSLSFILAPLLMAMVITIAIVPLPGRFMTHGTKSGVAW